MNIDKTDIENSKISIKNFKKWENSIGDEKGEDHSGREFDIRPVQYNGKTYNILFDNYNYIYGYDKFMPINQPYTLTDFRGIDKLSGGDVPKSTIPEKVFAKDSDYFPNKNHTKN